jgi:molecular chaperone GrpE
MRLEAIPGMASHNQDQAGHTTDPDELGEGFKWADDQADLTPEHELPEGYADDKATPQQKAEAPGEVVDKDTLRRALRELEASKARVERDAKRVYDETRSELVSEILPVLDNLDRAIQAVDGKCDEALVEGVRMVEGQLERVLGRFGLERIVAEGQRFDPQQHDAIAMVPVTDPTFDGLIVKQLEPGYRFGGRLLRPAKVVVGQLAH